MYPKKIFLLRTTDGWTSERVLEMVKKGFPLYKLSTELRSDFMICKAALEYDPESAEYVYSTVMTKDLSVYLLEKDGTLLRFMEKHKKDEEVCIAALTNNEGASCYIDPSLFGTDSILKMLEVGTSTCLFQNALTSFNMYTGAKFMERFLKNPKLLDLYKDILVLDCKNDALKNDFRFCELAMQSNEGNFEFMSVYCQKRWNFVHVFAKHTDRGEGLKEDIFGKIQDIYLSIIYKDHCLRNPSGPSTRSMAAMRRNRC